MGTTTVVKSVDTNILVRLITRDDVKQAKIADDIVRVGVYVPITVLLELGWILSSYYRFDRQKLNAAFAALLDNTAVHFDEEPAIRTALELHKKGADIADVFHLVAARGTEAFVTFDKAIMGDARIGVDVEVAG